MLLKAEAGSVYAMRHPAPIAQLDRATPPKRVGEVDVFGSAMPRVLHSAARWISIRLRTIRCDWAARSCRCPNVDSGSTAPLRSLW